MAPSQPLPTVKKFAEMVRLVREFLITLAISFAGALLTAIIPSSMANTRQFANLSITSIHGHTEFSPAGFAWNWTADYRLGSVVVNSRVIDRKFANNVALQSPTDESAPQWSIVKEKPAPPEVSLPYGAPFVDAGFGWPLPCLAYRVDNSKPNQPSSSWGDRIIYGSPIQILPASMQSPIWPTRLLWRGLVVDAIAIFPIAFAVVFVPSLVRSRKAAERTSRGTCGSCGYPKSVLGGDWKCPECGRVNRPDAQRIST